MQNYTNNKYSTKYIVIGAGPVGVRFVNELLTYEPQAHITLFGNEAHTPYNRVQLTALLAGDVTDDDIKLQLPDPKKHLNFNYVCSQISTVHPMQKCVVDKADIPYEFDKLIFATGARARIPEIPGLEQSGTYTFRNIDDATTLAARITRARDVVVIGGGLLGIEAAKAMRKANTNITLIQQSSRIMNRQLDDEAASRLQEKIENLNIKVITNSGVREINGNGRVTGVTTRDKQLIPCDSVIICAGIKPNMEIARNAKLVVNQGIVVDQKLQTSINNIYAIGECCEFQGATYGLVNPGFEQAAILANVLSGGSAKYIGSLEISRLKVISESVVSMGEVTNLINRPHQKELVYKTDTSYRKIILHRSKILGVTAIGEWDEASRVQEAYQQKRRVSLWQQLRFKYAGKLWKDGSANDIASWSDSAIICQCNGLNKAQLMNAVQNGCTNIDTLSKQTKAGTVCGSCKPLLQQLVGDQGEKHRDIAWLPIAIFSLSSLLIALMIATIPGLSVSDSVLSKSFLEFFWNDKFWKQFTGFSLVALSIIGLLMSLRKRLQIIKLGEFAHWRLVHVCLGTICVLILIFHTGMHLGENLNQALMINFISVIVLGAFAGAVVSFSHTLSTQHAIRLRKFWSWAHIIVTWPLPVLLGIHILTVYYF